MKKHDFSIRERIPFQAMSPVFHEVRKGGYITELSVLLRGSVTVSAGTTNGTSQGENPGGLIQRFDLDAISKGVYPGGKLKSLSPRSVLRRRLVDRGTFVNDLYLGAGGLTGAAGTFNLNMPFPLKFALPRIARSFETALNSDAYSGLTLMITCGGPTTQFTGNDRTWNFAATMLDIYDFREAANFPVGILYETDVTIPIQGANNRFPVNGELPKGEAFIDLLWLAQSTNQALVDTIINRITLFSGTDQFSDQYSDGVKALQNYLFNDQNESATGFYYSPIAKDGLLLGTIRDVTAVLDVSDPAPAAAVRLPIDPASGDLPVW